MISSIDEFCESSERSTDELCESSERWVLALAGLEGAKSKTRRCAIDATRDASKNI